MGAKKVPLERPGRVLRGACGAPGEVGPWDAAFAFGPHPCRSWCLVVGWREDRSDGLMGELGVEEQKRRRFSIVKGSVLAQASWPHAPPELDERPNDSAGRQRLELQ